MCQFIETIRIEGGVPQYLDRHIGRMNRTRMELLGLTNIVSPDPPVVLPQHLGLMKWRIVYAAEVIQSEIIPYQLKSLTSIKKVYDDEIDYGYKYSDRSVFEGHLKNNPFFDEILIIKNGIITDTSYSNICLYDGNEWLTPKYPLLKGIRRSVLLDQRKIREEDIRERDLSAFSKIALINAMLDLGDLVLPTDKIY